MLIFVDDDDDGKHGCVNEGDVKEEKNAGEDDQDGDEADSG